MNIHEYQAKELLRALGLPVAEGVVCQNPEEAGQAFTANGTPVSVVKAQIHAGGRGKGGGVKLVKSADEAVAAAREIMSKNLVTHQTGPEGQKVKTLLVEKGSDIKTELYVGIAMDRDAQRGVMMASSEGGMDIEVVAANTPEKILTEEIHPVTGLRSYQARRLAKGMGIPPELHNNAIRFLMGLAHVFNQNDCSLAEINPLVISKDGDLIALDAKMNFDENALFRQKKIAELRDIDEEEPTEIEAAEAGLSYVKLDGNIGCLVNGAGLAMGTMDIIKHHGGNPANFLDVGGGATAEQVSTAFKIILADPNVKGILVNIFGGILRCTTLANGICQAVKDVNLSVPLVVRLEGTEVEEGRKILENSGLPITTATDMADAANKIVKLVS
ncbi:MAG: ADP-forming succinate--CoA ligase subunit beta [Planctomycetota bacterium]